MNENTAFRGFRGHMCDRDFFRAMKPGTLFINPGRGKSVVTADLAAALEKHELAAAGLDVTRSGSAAAGSPAMVAA